MDVPHSASTADADGLAGFAQQESPADCTACCLDPALTLVQVWLRAVKFRLTSGDAEGARKTLDRSLQSLPQFEHVRMITQAGLLEFKIGDPGAGWQGSPVLRWCNRVVEWCAVFEVLFIKRPSAPESNVTRLCTHERMQRLVAAVCHAAVVECQPPLATAQPRLSARVFTTPQHSTHTLIHP